MQVTEFKKNTMNKSLESFVKKLNGSAVSQACVKIN